MSDRDRRNNNSEPAKESDGNYKNEELSHLVKEPADEDDMMSEYEGRREERRKSVKDALEEIMDPICFLVL